MQASTEWKEQIAPDEEKRFERYARDFAAMQERRSQKYGKGRALHRKQLRALKASFEVLPDLPAPTRHDLFASPGRHEAWIRLSNGGFDRASNAKPDIRGFAIKVVGVAGLSALGSGEATEQNFLLINHSAFAFPKSDECVEITMVASKGGGTSFPNIGLTVQPRKGCAVFFANTDAYRTPDPQTLHAGEPVARGLKYIATK